MVPRNLASECARFDEDRLDGQDDVGDRIVVVMSDWWSRLKPGLCGADRSS
jgi:hypothetical protein